MWNVWRSTAAADVIYLCSSLTHLHAWTHTTLKGFFHARNSNNEAGNNNMPQQTDLKEQRTSFSETNVCSLESFTAAPHAGSWLAHRPAPRQFQHISLYVVCKISNWAISHVVLYAICSLKAPWVDNQSTVSAELGFSFLVAFFSWVLLCMGFSEMLFSWMLLLISNVI